MWGIRVHRITSGLIDRRVDKESRWKMEGRDNVKGRTQLSRNRSHESGRQAVPDQRRAVGADPTLGVPYKLPDDAAEKGLPKWTETAPQIEPQGRKEVARLSAFCLILDQFVLFPF